MTNGENNIQREYLVCTFVLAGLVCISMFPLFSGISLFVLTPACLAYMFVRFALKYAVIPVVLTLLLPSLFLLRFDFSVLLTCVPFAAVLAAVLRRKKSLLYVVSAGVAGELFSAVLLFLVGAWAAGGVDAYYAQLSAGWAQAETQMTEMLNAAQIPAEVGTMYWQLFLSMLPAMVICMMASFSYLAFYICNAVLKRRDIAYADFYKSFCEIKADRSCVVAIIVFFILSLFASGIFARALVNIVIILAFFLFVCGFSAVCFFVKRIESRPLRIAVLVGLCLTIFVTSYLFMFAGFIDAFFNIRRLGKE